MHGEMKTESTIEIDKEKLIEIKNDLAFYGTLLNAINKIVDGNDPSDFEMSFDIVRRVMELKIEVESYRKKYD